MVDEQELDELYKQLGKAYYEGAFEDPLPELLPFFDAITKWWKQYQSEQVVENQTCMDQAIDVCPVCGNKVASDAAFCNQCGTKLKITVTD